MTRRIATALTLVVALGWTAAGCQPGTGDENPHHSNRSDPAGQLEYETDPRTIGRWMVHAVGVDTTDPGAAPRYFVTCWHDNDPGTFREITVTAQAYQDYRRNPDTGSIPCPATISR